MAKIQTVPATYTAVTPWVIVRGAADFIDWAREVFDAVERPGRMTTHHGAIAHAEIEIGGAVVMLFDSGDGWPETPAFLRVYVPDADAVVSRALASGGRVVTEPTELFFGDKVARFADRWGNLWWVHERVAAPTPEEMGRLASEPRAVEAMRYVEDSLTQEMRGRAR